MKIILTFIFLLYFAFTCHAQKYLDDITNKSCECMNKIDTTKSLDFSMSAGACMIDASLPYKKQLLKDFQLDLDQIENEGERLGKIIGLKMISVCPEKLIAITKKLKSEEKITPVDEIANGTVVKIEDDLFVILYLKDESGKTSKFFWLTIIHSGIDLMNNYKTLLNQNVKITFQNKEYFDPKIKEYRNFAVIKSIE